ncbi:MAG: mechanosensitive ion channel [Acidobacteria bacterium]|nr:mechanosensitive ion channel [Acidobacteriota bacterium]
MTSRQWSVTLTLLGLAVALVVGLVLTRDNAPSRPNRPRRVPLVDEKPLQTARSVATLATTWAEQRYAQQALKLADHDVDLAFAAAIRNAIERPAPPTPQTKELFERVSRAEAQVKASQERIEQLKKQLAAAPTTKRDFIQQQLDLAQAQSELTDDELDDARADLMRSGADPLTRIRRQFARHEATQQQAEATRPQPASFSPNFAQSGDLLGRFRAWYGFRDKIQQLQAAQGDAQKLAAALDQQRDALAQVVNQNSDQRRAVKQQAQSLIGQNGSAAASADAATTVASLKKFSDNQKDLADLAKRAQDEQDLANTYSDWISLVQGWQSTALNGILRSLLWIVLLILVFYVAGRSIDFFIPEMQVEHSRMRTLKLILRFAVQAVGVLLVLLVVFGAPQQTSTIIGLATAGLTVALKDFIVAFIGWFVLMGRNGIRAGDWVEINGVVGEVLEITLLRTVLLETGNWTDTGHPTGRKVAFMNGYAIEGHFFNFSTSGQWLWDEIQILVPADKNPYAVIDAIQKLVAKETEANARTAEQEWQRATGRYHVVHTVSAAPAVHLRPTGSGVEVYVRYITRAQDRFVVRSRLYQQLVDLLHGKESVQATEPAPATS